MVTDQLNLFPNLDILEKKVKNIDYLDISKLPDDPMRTKYGGNSFQYKNFPEDVYFIHKTGGTNRYKPEKGNIFPYIQNKNTGKVLSISSTKTDLYPKVSLRTREQDNPCVISRIHRLVGLAFFELPKTFYDVKIQWVVNHINHDITDYELSNLEWVTTKENSLGKDFSGKTQQRMKVFFQ
tara:strand:+ start:51 stop:593 length:543 start_codon:yes stop_codon:yes gene_type:complete